MAYLTSPQCFDTIPATAVDALVNSLVEVSIEFGGSGLAAVFECARFCRAAGRR